MNHSVMLLLLAGNAVAFFLMRSSAGRYFYINAIFLMPFTIRGLLFTWSQLERIPQRFHVKDVAVCLLLVTASLQIWNGLDNILPSKNEYFKQLGRKLANRQQQTTPRSGTRRITLLTIGDEYGWGLYARANSFAYTGKKIDKTWTLEEIAEKGLPSELANFVSEDLSRHETLLPDVIVIGSVKDIEPELIEKVRRLPGAEEFSFPDSPLAGKALFFSLNTRKSAR